MLIVDKGGESFIYKDIIYDWYVSLYGKEAVDSLVIDDPSSESFGVYRRLLKTCVNIEQTDGEPTLSFILSLLLLHYKYITAEQLRLLFPGATANYNILSLLTRTRSTKGLKQRNHLEAAKLDGTKKVYYLSDATYRRMFNSLPGEYTNHLRIPETRMVKINIGTSHAVATLNTPYRVLGDSSFMPFEWHDRLPVVLSWELGELTSSFTLSSIASLKEKYAFPDGIMHFTEENRYVLVEQDNGKETLPFLDRKHLFYGTYFTKHGEAGRTCTVLYNIFVDTESRIRKVALKANEGKLTAYTAAYRQICNDMSEHSFLTIAQEYDFLLHRLDRKKREKDALSLIKEYKDCNPGIALSSSVLEDLKGFVTDREAHRKDVCEIFANQTDEIRVRSIRSRIIAYAGSEAGAVFNTALQEYALSYVICTKLDFNLYAHFILLRESGYTDNLFKSILFPLYGKVIGISPAARYRYMAAGRISDGVRPFTLRNLYVASKVLPLFFIENISHDIGGYLRVRNMLSCITESSSHIILVLLVSSLGAASSLCDEVHIRERFCIVGNISRPRGGLWVSFIDYSSAQPRPFIPDEKGRPVYLFP